MSKWVLWVCQRSNIFYQKSPIFMYKSNTCKGSLGMPKELYILSKEPYNLSTKKKPYIHLQEHYIYVQNVLHSVTPPLQHTSVSECVKRALHLTKRALHFREESKIYAQIVLHSVIPPMPTHLRRVRQGPCGFSGYVKRAL